MQATSYLSKFGGFLEQREATFGGRCLNRVVGSRGRFVEGKILDMIGLILKNLIGYVISLVGH